MARRKKQFRFVDDTNGEITHLLFHYARANHHLYQEILDSLDDTVRVTLVAPTVGKDETDICNVTIEGKPLPDYEGGVEYTLDLFIEELVLGTEAEKFEPILRALDGHSPMIYADEFAHVNHPAELLSHPNLEVVVIDRMISPYCRDSGLFCDERVIVSACDESIRQKKADLERSVLVDRGFRVLPRIRNLDIYEGGEIISSGSDLYVSSDLAFLNQRSPEEVKRKLGIISKGRNVSFVQGGPAYHLDMFFAPVNDETVCVGDLNAGRRLLEETGIRAKSKELGSAFVSDLGLSYGVRQAYLDSIAEDHSSTRKVFRVPMITFTVGGRSFILTPLNLISTDTMLRVPTYSVPGFEEIRERMEEVAGYVGKGLTEITKVGAVELSDASIRCLAGNMERSYS